MQPITPASSFGNNHNTLDGEARLIQVAKMSTPPELPATKVQVNADKLNQLRARLIANRQSTPVKDLSNNAKSASSVPIKVESLSRAMSPAQSPKPDHRPDTLNPQFSKSSKPTAASILSQSNSIDALLAEGEATAQSQFNKPDIATQQEYPLTSTNTSDAQVPPVNTSVKTKMSPVMPKKHTKSVEQSKLLDNRPARTSGSMPNKDHNVENHDRVPEKLNVVPNNAQHNQTSEIDPGAMVQKSTSPAARNVHPLSKGPLHKSSLSLVNKKGNEKEPEYFKDIDLWLQITGFHDKTFREQKLKTHKQRAILEEKRRALELEFAELERQEAAAANDPSMNDYSRAASATYMPPPPVPVLGSQESESLAAPTKDNDTEVARSAPAGTKRPHSPVATNQNEHREKLSRLDTSGRAIRTHDLFDKPSSAGAPRRGSDHR